MTKDPRKGKKSRKHGRAARKPSHLRYNATKRREVNKARRQAKIQKDLAKKAARKERKSG